MYTYSNWLNAKAGLVEEEAPLQERKPPYSYATLIRLAILNSDDQKATLSDIYRWIQNEFVYYRSLSNPGWKNSIRHNLSLNKCFLKLARTRQDPGKGCYWTLNPLNTKPQAFDKKKRTLSLSLDFMEQSYVPDLKKIQEEHIKQWKKILADQITGLQTNTEISREESVSGLLLEDWLTTGLEVASGRPQPSGRRQDTLGPTSSLDWSYLEGLQMSDMSDFIKVNKEDISTESPQIKEEFTFADPVRSSLDDQLMFRCVDPSEVLGQQRTPHMVCQQQRLPDIMGLLQDGQQRLLQDGQQRLLQDGQQRFLQDGQQRLLQDGQQRLLQEGQQRLFQDGQQRLLQEGQQRLLQDEQQRLLQEGLQQQRLPSLWTDNETSWSGDCRQVPEFEDDDDIPVDYDKLL